MLSWLCRNLGFEELFVHRTDAGLERAELTLGSSLLILGRAPDYGHGRLGANRRAEALYLAVDDVDALAARFRSQGIGLVIEPSDRDDGSREFVFRDPEGNLWSCGTYWPKSKRKPSKWRVLSTLARLR